MEDDPMPHPIPRPWAEAAIRARLPASVYPRASVGCKRTVIKFNYEKLDHIYINYVKKRFMLIKVKPRSQ